MPTWTFAASAEVVAYRGARPVLVDVDARTLNATPETILAAVTPRTQAVIVVHFAGLPVEIDGSSRARAAGSPWSRMRRTRFRAESAAPGPLRRDVRTRPAPISFYATKTITTGEGGMLVTDDDAIAERARLMSLHGISRDAWKRYTRGGSWYYEIEDAGYKYNMTDIAAAIGLVQLDRADELLAARRALAAATRPASPRSPPSRTSVEMPVDAPGGSHAWHLYVVRLRAGGADDRRADVIDGLQELGIGTSVHFIPLHLHPYYRGAGATARGSARSRPPSTSESCRCRSGRE